MKSHPHLPPAVYYRDMDSLKDVRDNALAVMADECATWTTDMDWFRASLITPAAVVLWRVLIAEERSLVGDALSRVLGEMASRKSGETADAVPAPGENSRHLDGERDSEGDDEHASNG